MSKSMTVVFAKKDRPYSAECVEKLQESGFKVECCCSASEVLRLFEAESEERPAMLITVCDLDSGEEFNAEETREGRETGLALYRKLRLEDPSLPVIVITEADSIYYSLAAVLDLFVIPIKEDPMEREPTADRICRAASLLRQMSKVGKLQLFS